MHGTVLRCKIVRFAKYVCHVRSKNPQHQVIDGNQHHEPYRDIAQLLAIPLLILG